MLIREILHVPEVKLDSCRYLILHKFNLLAGAADLRRLGVQVGLLDHIAVRVADRIALGHAHQARRVNQLAIERELDIDRAAEVLPEAGAEAWHGVEIVKTVFELILAPLVKGRFRDVDIATSVLVGGADVVNDTLRADADIVLHVLAVARVLVGVVRVQHVVSLACHSERVRGDLSTAIGAGSLERLAHVVLLGLLCQTAMIVAFRGVRLL